MASTEAGRDLLFPGEQPPLSHLGATLLRHAVDSGLRYAFHNLGLGPPEPMPICIERLRLGLCPRRKLDLDAGDEVLAAVVAALEDPGGAGPLPGRLRGALLFHRTRLRLLPRRRAGGGHDSPREILACHLPALRDALLGEVVASLDRRRRRAAGATLGAVQSRQAARWLAGEEARLERLGVPDPYRPAWSVEPPSGAVPGGRVEGRPVPGSDRFGPRVGLPVHPLRGRFRESWRATASALHPLLHALGADAERRGLVEHPEDPFFLPLQVLDDLAADHRPDWLAGAVLANRAEYFALLRAADPTTRRAWELSPLAPLS